MATDVCAEVLRDGFTLNVPGESSPIPIESIKKFMSDNGCEDAYQAFIRSVTTIIDSRQGSKVPPTSANYAAVAGGVRPHHLAVGSSAVSQAGIEYNLEMKFPAKEEYAVGPANPTPSSDALEGGDIKKPLSDYIQSCVASSIAAERREREESERQLRGRFENSEKRSKERLEKVRQKHQSEINDLKRDVAYLNTRLLLSSYQGSASDALHTVRFWSIIFALDNSATEYKAQIQECLAQLNMERNRQAHDFHTLNIIPAIESTEHLAPFLDPIVVSMGFEKVFGVPRETLKSWQGPLLRCPAICRIIEIKLAIFFFLTKRYGKKFKVGDATYAVELDEREAIQRVSATYNDMIEQLRSGALENVDIDGRYTPTTTSWNDKNNFYYAAYSLLRVLTNLYPILLDRLDTVQGNRAAPSYGGPPTRNIGVSTYAECFAEYYVLKDKSQKKNDFRLLSYTAYIELESGKIGSSKAKFKKQKELMEHLEPEKLEDS